MGRILILSSNGDLASQLRRDIAAMNHGATIAELDGVIEAISTGKPDLILADLALSGGSIGIWRQLQYDLADSHIPTICLLPEDRIREVELLAGMDDFILHPYNVRELEARIKLILKQQGSDGDNVIRIGNLAIDAARYEVTVDGKPVPLTLKEYELLKYLATRRGRVITREVLLDQLWGYNYYGGTRTVDVHIGRLRTKIETGDYSFIRTVRGVGYVFSDE